MIFQKGSMIVSVRDYSNLFLVFFFGFILVRSSRDGAKKTGGYKGSSFLRLPKKKDSEQRYILVPGGSTQLFYVVNS